MFKKIILFSIILSAFINTKAQQLEYAKYITKELCAERFSGRGYVDDGVNKVAEYLVDEFKNCLKTLIEEIKIGALLVFFYYGLWSIYQFITRELNPNEFLLTAIIKFDFYFKWKSKYF